MHADRLPGYDAWKLQPSPTYDPTLCECCGETEMPDAAIKRGIRDCLGCAAPDETTIEHMAKALRKIAGPCMTEARRANCDCPRCLARRALAEVAG